MRQKKNAVQIVMQAKRIKTKLLVDNMALNNLHLNRASHVEEISRRYIKNIYHAAGVDIETAPKEKAKDICHKFAVSREVYMR